MSAAAPRADEGAERPEPKSVLRYTADPPERPDFYADGWEAGMEQGHRDLLILNEDRRVKARIAIADIFDGDFNLADTIVGTLHREGFEVVAADTVFMAPSVRSAVESLAAPPADEGAEPSLHIVRVCELCACGAGGECHVPGCAFWMHDAPTGDSAEEGGR